MCWTLAAAPAACHHNPSSMTLASALLIDLGCTFIGILFEILYVPYVCRSKLGC